MLIKQSKLLLLLAVWVFNAHGVESQSPPMDIHFKGNLIQNACTVKAGDENLQVAMDMHTDKDLYEKPRTTATPFHITLEECDPAISQSVKISFNGTASAGLPGYLAVSGAEGSMGFGLGIETPAGALLKLNDINSARAVIVRQGTTIISLQAFLQAEPLAVTNKNIKLGEYVASATFMLEYL
jgi:type 1 fimbria pilin